MKATCILLPLAAAVASLSHVTGFVATSGFVHTSHIMTPRHSLLQGDRAGRISMSLTSPEHMEVAKKEEDQAVAPGSQSVPFFKLIEKTFKKNAATLGVMGAVLAGMVSMPDVASAARSGGRMGGRSSFSGGGSSMRMSPSPRSSYGGGYSRGGGVSVMPIPIPVPSYGFGYSPFGGYGYGGGFGYGGGIGISPVSLLVLGAVAYTASQVISRGTNFNSYDEDSYSSLGEGVSVVKLQIGLNCADRSRNGILGQISEIAANADTSNMGGLSAAVSEAALALVRKQSDWVAGATAYEHLRGSSASSAESKFNQLSIVERMKVEKETFVAVDGRSALSNRGSGGAMEGGPTQGVVTLVVALRGNSLKSFGLDKMVTNRNTLTTALAQLAGDALSDDGNNVLAAELLWTPEEPWDTMDRAEMIVDFPNLVDL